MNNLFEIMYQELNEVSEKMPLEDIKAILQKLKLKIQHEDKLTVKKTVIIVNPAKEAYEDRSKAAQVLMKVMKAHKPRLDMEQDRRPVVYVAGWKIVFKPIAGEKEAKATDYEAAIAAAWNDINNIEHNIEYNKNLHKVALKVAKYLKGKTKGSAKHIGAASIGAVSEFWKTHTKGRVDTTPKTDILIGESRVSIKMGDKSQLCSAKVIGSEGEALLYHALDKSGADSELTVKIESILNKNKLASVPPKTSEELEEYKIYHKEITTVLRTIVDTNLKFRNAFIKEALTGKRKFEGVAMEPIADTLLASSFSADKIAFKGFSNSYIDKIADQVVITINFKSSGNTKYSALRAIQKHIFDSLFLNIAEPNVLTEDYLVQFAHKYNVDLSVNEGIKDTFVRMFNILKSIARKGIHLLFKVLKIDVRVSVTINDINFF